MNQSVLFSERNVRQTPAETMDRDYFNMSRERTNTNLVARSVRSGRLVIDENGESLHKSMSNLSSMVESSRGSKYGMPF